MPTSNGLSNWIQSLPRRVCPTGACKRPASSITSAWAPRVPAPQNSVTVLAVFIASASAWTCSALGTTGAGPRSVSPRPRAELIEGLSPLATGTAVAWHRWSAPGKEAVGRGCAHAVHQLVAEVLGQDLGVVLPDRPVQPGQRQDDVAGGPHRGAQDEPMADLPGAQRPLHQPEQPTPGDPVAPVNQVVGQRGPLGWELALEDTLDDPLADLRGGGRMLPVLQSGRELPCQQALLAAAELVAGELDQVHGGGADRPRGKPLGQRAERGQPRSCHHISLPGRGHEGVGGWGPSVPVGRGRLSRLTA